MTTVQRRRLRGVLLACLAVGAMAAAPSSALASFATVNTTGTNPPVAHGTIFISGGSEASNMTISRGGGASIVIVDTAGISAGSACTQDSGTQVTCTPNPRLFGISADLGAGNDTLVVNLELPAPRRDDQESTFLNFDGGEGNDNLTGSDGADVGDNLNGDLGDDTLNGRRGDDSLFDTGFDVQPGQTPPPSAAGGNDTLNGGEGDDDLRGGLGTDVIDGGAGADSLTYSERRVAVTVNLAPGAGGGPSTGNGAAGENDSLSNIEDVSGGSGDDKLSGSDAPNTIDGFDGNDEITGLGAPDDLSGGPGDDIFHAKDSTTDVVRCGTGTNTGEVDDIDFLTGSCSGSALAVTKVVPTDTSDKTKPNVALKKFKKKLKRKAFFKGVKGQLAPNEATTNEIQLLADLRPRRGALAAKVGDVVVSSKTIKAGPGAKSFKLKIKKKLRKSFPRRFKVRLTIRSTDAGGNVTKIKRTIKVR